MTSIQRRGGKEKRRGNISLPYGLKRNPPTVSHVSRRRSYLQQRFLEPTATITFIWPKETPIPPDFFVYSSSTKPPRILSQQSATMTDRLTQLQDCLDQLLDRMYMSINYVTTYHSYGSVDGQPSQDPFTQERNSSISQHTSNPTQPSSAPLTSTSGSVPNSGDLSQQTLPQQGADQGPPRPHDPATFARNLSILSQDLVLKEQQIEFLIESLPGIGTSQREQEARIVELEEQLKGLDREREEAFKERRRLERVLEGVLAGVRRV
jgi:mediator of RNA polymerase II transcription subunit 21